jgi:hypothetical protein
MAQCDARRIRKTAQRQSGLLLPSREEKSMADGNRYEKRPPGDCAARGFSAAYDEDHVH